MESWQKTFIKKHLPRFIEETTVNEKIIAFLVADDVLSNVDVQNLEANTGGNMAKAKALYDQLFTRTNGYKAIGKATYESKQSGTFLLLLRGLVRHLLQQSNINLEEATVDEILKTECLTDDVWKFFCAKVDKETLYEDNWVAAPRPFYIPRYISNRIKVKPEVFKQNCSDVFVLTGITRPQLSTLAEPNQTALSSQVINKNMTMIRFVLLEHEHHWDVLKTVWPEKPIHLIQFDSNTSEYILQNSTRPSEVVSNHVPPHSRDKSLYVPEEQFLTQISNEKDQRAICICDTPGMGKTWLLENMAHQIQQRETGRMIAVIGLQRFVEQTLASSQHSIRSNNPILILLKYLCPFRLTSTLLERAVENNQIQLELFLDGFDETPKEHIQTTQEFFKSVAENRPNVNLIITSRPHMRSELERTFKGVAFDILPFSEENQVDFLVQFWQKFAKRPQELNSERLRLFAQESLNFFKTSLTKEESEMMGIPLQCYLLATVNLINAELYCHQDSTSDITEFISPTSLYDMYTIYFEMGIDRAIGIHGHINNEAQSGNPYHALKKLFRRAISKLKFVKTRSETLGSQEGQKLKAYHVWVALQLLIPDLAEDYRRRESIPDLESERILACGVLQNCSSDKASPTAMTFVHRTFAEYLVAEHFVEIITSSGKLINNGMLHKYIRFFVKFILSTQRCEHIFSDLGIRDTLIFDSFEFSNSAIVCFLNASLQSNTEMSSSNPVSQNLMELLYAKYLPKILSACITSSYANIIRLFKNLLKPMASKISSDNLTLRDLVVSSTHLEGFIFGISPDPYYSSVRGYLCQAAEISTVNVLEELYSFFEECLQENLNEFCSKMPKDHETPLHFAVHRVDYSMVEYFASQVTLPGRRILFSFPRNEDYESQNAIEICELLLRNDSLIIFEKNEHELYKTNGIIVHVRGVKLIKFLVERGADARATRIHRFKKDGNDTLLTINARSMDEDEFGELCRYLIYEIKAYDLFTPNLPFWNDPLPQIINSIDDDILTSILQIPGIKLDGMDDGRNNLVLVSIQGNRKLSRVKCLVDLGVDAFAKNYNDENALYLAVESGKLDTTEYLLSLGFNLEERDYDEYTPLHHANRNFEMMKFLILKNANILAANDDGENIAHLALKSYHAIDKKAVVLYLMSLREGTELFKMRNKWGRTPLHEWLANSDSNPDSETVKLILQTTGEDVNATDYSGGTMFLHAANIRNSVACLKSLKKFGANHNVTNADGSNALHISAFRGFLESTKYLVSIGLSPELQDYQGNTPLFRAAESQKVKVIKYMISQNENVLAVNNDGHSIAHLLFIHNTSKNLKTTVEYLLTLPQAPQLFKMTNKKGRTPLHEWLANRDSNPDSETVELILQTSVEDVNATDYGGWTMFLHSAYTSDSVECLKRLKKFGANHNVTNAYGRNALHISAFRGFLESTKYLVSIGLSLELQDNEGKTPFLRAAYSQKVEVIKYMISQNANVLAVNNDGDNIAHLLFIHNTFKNLKTTVEYLLTLPQAPQLFKMTNKNHETPLQVWIKYGYSSPDPELKERMLQICGDN